MVASSAKPVDEFGEGDGLIVFEVKGSAEHGGILAEGDDGLTDIVDRSEIDGGIDGGYFLELDALFEQRVEEIARIGATDLTMSGDATRTIKGDGKAAMVGLKD